MDTYVYGMSRRMLNKPQSNQLIMLVKVSMIHANTFAIETVSLYIESRQRIQSKRATALQVTRWLQEPAKSERLFLRTISVNYHN